MAVRIGVHPQTHSLTVLSRSEILQRHLADVGEQAEFVAYADGTLTPRLIAEDAFDLVGTGATPPVTAQADGTPLVYVATSEPRPGAASLVVPADSPIGALGELAGKRVGFAVGSWQTSLLALALHEAGLRWDDVEIVDTHADESGIDRARLDAWVASEPELSSDAVRVLLPTGSVFSNRSVFYARRELAQRPELLGRVVAAIEEAERWTAADPVRAAALVTEGTGRDAAKAERQLRSRPWGLIPIGEEFVGEQQRAADALAAAGQIAAPVRIADAVLDEVQAVVAETLERRGAAPAAG